MINRITLLGNIGKDPELKTLDGGNTVANFSLATNENYKNKNGEWQQQTEWHNIAAWGKLAERCKKLKKGDLTYLEGKIKTRKYESEQGTKYTTDIIANMIRVVKRNDEGYDEGRNKEDLPF